MIRRSLSSTRFDPCAPEACRRWYVLALAAHAAFAAGDVTEREYRGRLRALGCGRAEIDEEVVLRRALERRPCEV